MTDQIPLLRLQDRHITSLQFDDVDMEDTFRHHRSMAKNPPNERIVPWLQIAGFYHATFIRGYKLVPGLITALIERWRPETHTFHMPCGECTITLEDIVMLIGVPVNGKPLIEHTEGTVQSICEKYLHKVPYESNVRGARIKMSWLQSEFQLNEYSTDEEIYCASRAYILQLIGGILLPDKSGSLVHTRYLRFLDSPLEASSYSWGSAILAFLYHELCKAVILEKGEKVRTVGGCLLLLQAWAWERLPFFTPITRSSIDFPLVGRWCAKKAHTGLAHNNVKVCRSKIDLYCKDQFIWMSYNGRGIDVPDYLMVDSTSWCSFTPLIHFAIIEFQFGDRVLRQFGFHQPIPQIPPDLDFLHEFDGRGRADVNWEVAHAQYVNMWNNRGSSLSICTQIQANDFDFESSEYSIYYRNNGKPYLTTIEGREECQKYKKKYGGKGESSNSAKGGLPMGPSMGGVGGPPMGGASAPPVTSQRNIDDVEAYIPEFYPQESPIYSNFGENFDFHEMMCSPDIMRGQNSECLFTTPTHIPSMTEEIINSEEDPNAQQRPQRERRPPQCYLSTTPRHGQKLRKK